MAKPLTQGALAGMAATLPMTLSMVTIRHFAPDGDEPMQMEQVARGVAKKMRIYREMDRSERDTFTWISHFGFGAAAGALFPLLAGKTENHAVIKGVAFGMGVWATSYLGVLPKMGIMRFPTREPTHTVVEEIVSHVVWGAALGLVAKAIGSSLSKSTPS